MSLFEESKKQKNPFGEKTLPKTKENETPFINQTSILLRVINAVLEEQKLSSAQASDSEGFRTRLGDTSWPLHNLQGNVTEPSWANMVNAAIAGMFKTVRNSQPNGDWKVLDFESKIDHDSDQIERLYLVVKLVDIDNEDDLQSRNGAPVAATVNVQNNPIPAEVLEALVNRPSDEKIPSSLTAVIEQLAQIVLADKTKESKVEADPIVSQDPDPEPVVFSD